MVGPKRLEILHELVLSATRMVLLVNSTSPNLAEADTKEQQAAARTLGLQLHVLQASSEREFDAVFATAVQQQAGGLVIGTDSLFNTWKEQLAAVSVRHRVPTIHQYREFAVAGGLISYGSKTSELSRQVGVFTGRILKGEKPADMPIQQAVNVELNINLKAAKALGLTIPRTLLARADEVIE
jgi:putative tryptophan/tyrosine transport system substrate-binding protein